MDRILTVSSPGERRAVLLRDGAVWEYVIDRPGAPDELGALQYGRVIQRVPAMAGAFVALDGAEGFLPDTEGAAGLNAGDHVAVRVIRAAQGGKGPRVSARLSEEDRALATPGPVRRLRPGPAPLEELQAAYPDAVAESVGAFPDPVADMLATLEHAETDLPGGMRASFSPTPALTAIDVDGGSATAERGGKDRVQLEANRRAIPALVRQIVLRNLSGAILIDFAGMQARRRPVLADDLRATLGEDRAGARLLGFTALGLAEIVRPRLRPPLHEMLAGPLAAGLAALRAAAADPGRKLALLAHPGVVSALQADPVALPELARITTYPLALRADPALPANAWSLET